MNTCMYTAVDKVILNDACCLFVMQVVLFLREEVMPALETYKAHLDKTSELEI